MTLKEKIDDALFYTEPKITIVKLEKIADEFAIEFKDWCDTKGRFWIGANTTKEILEIYKKEKGL